MSNPLAPKHEMCEKCPHAWHGLQCRVNACGCWGKWGQPRPAASVPEDLVTTDYFFH